MYLAAGVNLRIETNSESILQITEQMFGQSAAGFSDREDIRLRLWVDEMRHADEPRPKPYFRGLGHMVFAGFDESTSVLMNPHDRSAVGRFTPEAAVDTRSEEHTSELQSLAYLVCRLLLEKKKKIKKSISKIFYK